MHRLQLPNSRTGRLTDLVGPGWAHSYRVLHPADEERDGQRTPLSWAEVGRRRGVPVDLPSADWYDVSGSRLHHPKGADAVGEPEAGPTSAVLLPVLRAIAATRKVDQVVLAEWTGYDERQAGRPLQGAVFEGVRHLGQLDYSLWRAPLSQAVELIGADRLFRSAPDQAVLANFVFDASEDWLVAADGDLASTYVATQFAVTQWPPELEWTEVAEDVRLA